MRRALLIAGLLFLGLAVVGGWVWSSLYLPYQGFSAPGVYRGYSARRIEPLDCPAAGESGRGAEPLGV